eukprot:COSAG01_NODE_1464_length_10228_cov_6.040774_7_plen_186_part_00
MDVPHPKMMEAHYDAEWHEKWSKLLLISAEGSGINFHQHTTAFNGLVFGAKRWFLYPPGDDPPSAGLGMMLWFKDVYKSHWAAPQGKNAGRNGLQQCMQMEGDLMYVPQSWWHATIALGEGIALSGVLERQLAKLLTKANQAHSNGDHQEHIRLLKFITSHHDEIETDMAVAVAVHNVNHARVAV